MLARELAEVPLAGESPQLPDPFAAVHGQSDRLHDAGLREIAVALVDRAEVEGLFQARVMEVELFVELCDEAVGLFAIRVELSVG